ncbi:hypothetical protein V8E53_015847 [Lactarius tabidus]
MRQTKISIVALSAVWVCYVLALLSSLPRSPPPRSRDANHLSPPVSSESSFATSMTQSHRYINLFANIEEHASVNRSLIPYTLTQTWRSHRQSRTSIIVQLSAGN